MGPDEGTTTAGIAAGRTGIMAGITGGTATAATGTKGAIGTIGVTGTIGGGTGVAAIGATGAGIAARAIAPSAAGGPVPMVMFASVSACAVDG
jgi:hypothetical protein